MDINCLQNELLEKKLKEIENLSKEIKNYEQKIKQQLLLVNEFFEIQNLIYKKQKNKEVEGLENLSSLALDKSKEVINCIGNDKFEINNTNVCYSFRGLKLHKKYNK